MTPEVDDSQARLVVAGSPWVFESYSLAEVLERNGSALSDSEVAALGEAAYSNVVLTFEPDGGGTETGFDPIPSSFLWKLNSVGRVVFLDQNGREFESPLGRFEVNVPQERIRFTSELERMDENSGVPVVFRGTATFR